MKVSVSMVTLASVLSIVSCSEAPISNSEKGAADGATTQEVMVLTENGLGGLNASFNSVIPDGEAESKTEEEVGIKTDAAEGLSLVNGDVGLVSGEVMNVSCSTRKRPKRGVLGRLFPKRDIGAGTKTVTKWMYLWKGKAAQKNAKIAPIGRIASAANPACGAIHVSTNFLVKGETYCIAAGFSATSSAVSKPFVLFSPKNWRECFVAQKGMHVNLQLVRRRVNTNANSVVE